MPDLPSLLGIAAVLSVGIFVQSAAGFAAGLLIVPMLLWLGYTIPEASMALLVATVPQNVMGVYSLRDSIRPKQLLWPGIGRIVFFPIGIGVLVMIENTFSIDRIRQLVGGAVLIATIAIILYRPHPKPSISVFWAWLAFPLSGFCQGLIGMGGPAMVFWVSAHDWSTRQIRGFLFSMYLISLGPALAILWWKFGERVLPAAFIAIFTLPALMLVTWLGLRFGNWLGRERLRRVTLGLLLLLGLIGLASPWLHS
ncbi:sulfite exporter TauE/SafE family protein [Roseiconus lacunae]|uniref:Probable membrane transporter protein n=1 Tax=Roseiconus lacunae TaxID=2605694 RepID=A0ABT7PF82_9BACT|nr:sulfite exporter TauE/SafE family protein [Roseiconus lacunae]MCD0462473.1 sulfite exporter TauE/SafE family protein [Roseiconus lacunae]MDM4015155.1 sulfite exporter TauE/SafE family protein [Roseiconus lacunae]WRQ50162.1 sulfite exporter TauE/SafE family protein [Stieleria sp. HD01]